MRRRELIALLGGAAVAAQGPAAAQTPGKVARVGFLGNSTAALEEKPRPRLPRRLARAWLR
jgi:hypothetical protein